MTARSRQLATASWIVWPSMAGKATFFMVGERVGSYKTEVQRMVAEGHEVANHTMNHKYLQKLGAAQIQAQVNNGNDAIQAACGRASDSASPSRRKS